MILKKKISKTYNTSRQRVGAFPAFLDKFIYIVGIVGPGMTIPQVLKIWIGRDASGISVLTWSGYVFFAFFWLAYGFTKREIPLILTNIIIIILSSLVVIGTLLYG